VVYAGGSAAAALITAYNPTVTSPQIGYVYALSVVGGTNSGTATSDFNGIAAIAVDSNGNLYAGDSGGVDTTTSGTLASSIGLQIKKFVTSPTPGWVTFMSNVGNVAGTANGDGGPATSATTGAGSGGLLSMAFDANNNLYIGDTVNESIRVVYFTAGSPTPPLYVNAANPNQGITSTGSIPAITQITNPVVGDIYTVVGGITGGSHRNTGDYAFHWINCYIEQLGFDQAGNLLVMIDNDIVRVSQATGIATIIGGAVNGTGGTEVATPAPGARCNNGTAGPTMTNAYGDGCPAMQVQTVNASCCRITADNQGNFYIGDYRSSNVAGVIQKYTFTGQFGQVATGSSATQLIAFTPTLPVPPGQGLNYNNYTYAATTALTTGGSSTTEFADAGTGDYCVSGTAGETDSFQTCDFNITFTPQQAGTRVGGLAVSSTSALLDSINLGGIGSGANLSIDPGTQTTIGTGLTPYGTALDQAGDFYIASGTTTGILYKSVAGGAPISFATGFSSPKQVAVTGNGTVYVADSGNNRIAAVTQAGVVSSYLASPFHMTVSTAATSLSNPSGVAVDALGDLFLSDTGNNRVIEYSAFGGISTVGFSGLSSPLGLAVDSSGDLFVADSGNKRVVELSAAGVQSVVTVSPALTTPVAVGVDAAGDLYIADSGNQNVVLVPAGSTTATTLLTSTASLNGLAADDAGDLAISASGSPGLIRLNRSNITYTFPGATTSGNMQTSTFTLTDTGNAALTTGATLGSSTDTTDFSLAPATTNGCTTNQSIVPGSDCGLAATFAPKANSGAILTTVTFPSSNASNKPSAALTGNTVIVLGTTITITAASNPVPYGANANLTIQVTPASGTAPAPGTITITQNGTSVGSPITLSGTGGASYSGTGLIPGTYSYIVNYSGAYGFAPSTASLTVVVSPPPPNFTLSLANSTSTVVYSNSIINTLTITPVQYSGYNLVTSLTCTGQPLSVSSCTVVPGSVTPNGGPVTAVVTLQTGSLVGSLRGARGNLAFALTIFGAAGLFGLVRDRRRRWPKLLALLLCLSALTTLNGCNTLSNGTYNLIITGTGSGGQNQFATWTVAVQNEP
jgi:sugar lactone lactonase YvrE